MQLACTVLVYSICVPQCLAFGIIPDHTTSATHSVSATPGLGDYTAAILAGMLLEREAATSTTTRTSTHTTTIITTIYDPHLTATESCRGPLSNCVLFPATAFSPKRAQASAPIPTGDFGLEGPPPDSTIVSISPTSSSAQEAHAYIPIATGDFGLEGPTSRLDNLFQPAQSGSIHPHRHWRLRPRRLVIHIHGLLDRNRDPSRSFSDRSHGITHDGHVRLFELQNQHAEHNHQLCYVGGAGDHHYCVRL